MAEEKHNKPIEKGYKPKSGSINEGHQPPRGSIVPNDNPPKGGSNVKPPEK